MAIAAQGSTNPHTCTMRFACSDVSVTEQHTFTGGNTTICKTCIKALYALVCESEKRENARMMA